MLNSSVRTFLVASLLLATTCAWAGIVTVSAPGMGSVNLNSQGGQGNAAGPNLALGGTAFAQDVIGVAPHSIAGVNDGVHGNSSSWIPAGQNSFIGINLGSTPVTFQSVAFGRDNLGMFVDRTLGTVEVQITTVAVPDTATAETGNAATGWQSLFTATYNSTPPASALESDSLPSLRHVFNLSSAVSATGVRLKVSAATSTSGDIGIDELELFGVAYGSQFVAASANATTALFTTTMPDVSTPVGHVFMPSAGASQPRRGGPGVSDVAFTEGGFNNHASVTGLMPNTNYIVAAYGTYAGGTGLIYSPTSSIRTLDNNADLGSIIFSAGTLAPALSPAVTSYSLGLVPNSVSTLFYQPFSDSILATVIGPIAVIPRGLVDGQSLSVGVLHNFSITVVAEDGTMKFYNFSALRATVAQSDPALSALAASSGALSPVFASGTTSYTLPNVPNATTSITVTPTVAQGGSTVKVNGSAATSGSAFSVALTPGDNTITVLSTAEDGVTTRSYTLAIHRYTTAEEDPALGGLVMSAGTLDPAFASGTTSYAAQVGFATSSLTITPTQGQPGQTLRVNGSIVASGAASAALPLSIGNTPLTVAVTAADGVATRNYGVTVLRTAQTPQLTALTLSEGSLIPAFASATTSYSASVGNASSSITLTPTANAGLVIRVNGVVVASGTSSSALPLVEGPNTITLVVTAEDDITTRTYTLTVNRLTTTPALTTLSRLTTSAGPVSPFLSDAVTAYTLRVPNSISSLTVEPLTKSFGTAQVNGVEVPRGSSSAPVTLAVGDTVITLTTTSQDGTTTGSYTLTVTRYSVPRIGVEVGGAVLPGMRSTVVAAGGQITEGVVPPGLEGVKTIAAGGFVSFAVRHDGSVVAWGLNGDAQSTVPATANEVEKISVGPTHVLALHRSGQVSSWGSANPANQPPADLAPVADIVAGEDNSMVIFTNKVGGGWGPHFNPPPSPLPFFNLRKLRAFGSVRMLIYDSPFTTPGFTNSFSGSTRRWTGGGNAAVLTPAAILVLDGSFLSDVAVNTSSEFYKLTEGGTLQRFFLDGIFGFQPQNVGVATKISSYSSHSLALMADGTVRSVGVNTFGQRNFSPSHVRDIAAGHAHSLAVVRPTAVVSLLNGSRILTIRNTGSDVLTLGTPVLEGLDAVDFSATAPASTTLASGATTTLTVSVSPGLRARSALLRLPNNDITTGGVVEVQVNSTDLIAPVLTLPANVTLNVSEVSQAAVTYPPATAVDDVDPAPVITYSAASGSSFPIGTTTVTVTATDAAGNATTGTFTVTLSLPMPMLVTSGGSFLTHNRAAGSRTFAKDEIGIAPHAIANVADGAYANASSWIAGSTDSFVGVSLGSTAISVNRVAFGRDQTRATGDRWQGTYIIERTTVADPNASTPDSAWLPIALMDYNALQLAGTLTFPAERHVWFFPAVQATGIRLRVKSTAANNIIAIDELEIYDSTAAAPASQLQLGLEGLITSAGTATLVGPLGGTGTRKVWLRNYGSSSVSIASLSLLGGSSATFSLSTSGMSTTLAAGAATSATLSFSPTNTTPQTATLRVLSDDTTNPQLDLVLTGTSADVIAPVITPPANITADITSLAGANVSYPAATVVDDFDPAPVVTYSKASGSLFPLGDTTVFITASDSAGNIRNASFTVTVSASLTVTAGGAFMPGNLAPGRPVWTSSEVGIAPHAVANINDGVYGNPSSWIGGAPLSALGINLGATPVTIGQVAFGRDNTGQFADRWTGLYNIEVTTTPNPGISTPENAWVRLGTADLTNGAVPLAGKRRLISFAPIAVTGVRLLTQSTNSSSVAVDEFEVYDGSAIPSPAGLELSHSGSGVPYGSSFHYGIVTEGVAFTRSFRIYNTGSSTESLSVSLSGGQSADFALNTSGMPASLAPGGVATFSIALTATQPGARSTTLQINAMTVTLTGTGGDGTPPSVSHANVVHEITSVGSAVVTYAPATVSDNLDPAPLVSYSHPSGSSFPMGSTLVTVTATDASGNIGTATFTVTVRFPLPVLIDQSGTAYSGNLAASGSAFAKDHIAIAPHTVSSVKDGVFGDASSWIAGSSSTFIGINLGGTPVTIGKLAFGRDNTGAATDRWSGIYTIQFTTVPNPHDGTPDASWHDLGTLDYSTLPQTGLFSLPARRHVWRVHPVQATGLRLRVSTTVGFGSQAAIDELELYAPGDQTAPILTTTNQFVLIPAGQSSINVNLNGTATAADDTDPAPVVTYSPASGSAFARGTTTTITTTATDAVGNSRSATFTLTVTGASLLAQGGSFAPANLATGRPAFAKDQIGIAPHAITNINDGIYGNPNSWIAGTNDTFIGINLGATPITLNRVAFGRDNTAVHGDRWPGTYILQSTTVPNPDASTPDGSWTTIETLDYSTLPQTGSFDFPARRHLWAFADVPATGFRLKITSPPALSVPVAIDELELYGTATILDLWRSTHFGAATTNIGNLDDFDGDGSVNLLEFAQGTLPNNAKTGSLSYTGNVITPGSPISDGVNAVFIRRKDYLAAGLTYTVEFSPDLSTWTPSSTTPTVLADDGVNQVVSIPMPAAQTRHFFHVSVTQ